MKRFFKRLAVLPIVLVAVAVSILLWIGDIAYWFFTGVMNSHWREAWEDSEFTINFIDKPFTWSAE